MQPQTILAATLVIIAPAIGSFLAVLADRLPRGEDVLRAPSRCRACQTRMAPRDLVPVLSFALSAGRCRTCKAPIPPFLLYMEISATGLAVLAALASPTPGLMVASVCYLWLLLALIATDLLWFRLPDVLTLALLIVAVALAVLDPAKSLPLALTAAALGAASFAAIRIGYRKFRGVEGLGLGDVKLIAGLGAASGPADLPLLVLIASLLGLAATVLYTLRHGTRLSARLRMPFGAALAASGAIIWLIQHSAP